MEGSGNAAVEAALGLSPQLFMDEILDTISEVRAEAFECCLEQAAAPEVLGAAKAAQKAAELERAFNAIHHVIKKELDKRMSEWEKFCLQHCFTVPEGFMVPEDDNSCAKDSQKDGTSDSRLDVELDSLRRKLESAYKESENLKREISSLERQTAYKRKLDFSIAEIRTLFDDKFAQKNFEDLAKAIPILQQKIMGMNKKRTETRSLVDQQVWNMNGLRDNKLLASDKGFISRTDDIQEIINILQN